MNWTNKFNIEKDKVKNPLNILNHKNKVKNNLYNEENNNKINIAQNNKKHAIHNIIESTDNKKFKKEINDKINNLIKSSNAISSNLKNSISKSSLNIEQSNYKNTNNKTSILDKINNKLDNPLSFIDIFTEEEYNSFNKDNNFISKENSDIEILNFLNTASEILDLSKL